MRAMALLISIEKGAPLIASLNIRHTIAEYNIDTLDMLIRPESSGSLI